MRAPWLAVLLCIGCGSGSVRPVVTSGELPIASLAPEMQQRLRQGLLLGFDLLYVPIALHHDEVSSIVVVTPDGVEHRFERGDAMDVAFDRVALRIPSKITRGALVVSFDSRPPEQTPFDMVTPGGAPTFVSATTSDALECARFAGDWRAEISGEIVRVRLAVLPDCDSVEGVIEAAGSERTLVGTTTSDALQLHDGQIFGTAVSTFALPCGSTYEWTIAPDGQTMSGSRTGCGTDASVRLTRVR